MKNNRIFHADRSDCGSARYSYVVALTVVAGMFWLWTEIRNRQSSTVSGEASRISQSAKSNISSKSDFRRMNPGERFPTEEIDLAFSNLDLIFPRRIIETSEWFVSHEPVPPSRRERVLDIYAPNEAVSVLKQLEFSPTNLQEYRTLRKGKWVYLTNGQGNWIQLTNIELTENHPTKNIDYKRFYSLTHGLDYKGTETLGLIPCARYSIVREEEDKGEKHTIQTTVWISLDRTLPIRIQREKSSKNLRADYLERSSVIFSYLPLPPLPILTGSPKADLQVDGKNLKGAILRLMGNIVVVDWNILGYDSIIETIDLIN
jgi:hypothetical protein